MEIGILGLLDGDRKATFEAQIQKAVTQGQHFVFPTSKLNLYLFDFLFINL